MSTQQHVPQHVNLPHHVGLPQHDGMSTCQHVGLPQHAHQLVPKHATQLAKTTVPVVGTVSRRIDPEQTELEEDSIPRPATLVMFWLIYVTMNIQNVLLRLECRHEDVCATDQCHRQ